MQTNIAQTFLNSLSIIHDLKTYEKFPFPLPSDKDVKESYQRKFSEWCILTALRTPEFTTKENFPEWGRLTSFGSLFDKNQFDRVWNAVTLIAYVIKLNEG